MPADADILPTAADHARRAAALMRSTAADLAARVPHMAHTALLIAASLQELADALQAMIPRTPDHHRLV